MSRKYSVTLVVTACVILVAFLNFTAAKEASGSLFDSLASDQNNSNPLKNKIIAQTAKENNLATAPLTSAAYPVDAEALLEENHKAETGYFPEALSTSQNQVLLASLGPVLPINPKSGNRSVRSYNVKEGETISAIAAANGVSTKTLLWANNLSEDDIIKPGDKISILPVTGVKHKVRKGDNVKTIAKKYNADADKIIAYNDLPANGDIKEGAELIIPDGYISTPTTTPATTRLASASQRQHSYSRSASVESYAPSGKLSKRAGSGHRFPYGYCTWYVASRKYIPWGGNAGSWLANARASGKPTGKTPKPGAIIVTGESRWGHVGIVEKVSGNKVVISEMNYSGFGKKNTRTLNAKSRVIKGYIY